MRLLDAVGRGRFLISCSGFGLVLAGCAATPDYDGAFSSRESVKGNSELISAPVDPTWSAAVEVVAQQGFIIEQADTKGRIILATKEMRNKEDSSISHSVRATVTVVPVSDQTTRVLLSANQTTELHKKNYVWWKLLWLIPLFPVGSEYTTVVTERDTVKSPAFYQQFFSELKKVSDNRKLASPTIDGTADPLATQPTTP
ncbi:MAG: hypothetical protein ACT4P0_01055 [Panacagrimonas sp.]